MSSDPTMTLPATGGASANVPYQPAPARLVADRPRRLHHVAVLLWSMILAVVMFAPLLGGRGISLRGEMVFVARQPVKGSLLGLDGWSTGAVPADFLVSLITTVIPGDMVQKAILLTIVVLAGTGVGALLSRLSLVARLAAVTFFVWNPFVYERLLVGDWTLLAGYAALPWIAWAARRMVTGSPREVAPVVAFLALAAWTDPVGGVIALLLAFVLVVRKGVRTAVAVLVTGLVVNLPWIIPGLLRPGGPSGSEEAVAAYAATPETPLGLLGSLATLGGIWDPAAYVSGRDNLILAILALAVSLLALAGAVFAPRRWDGGLTGGIAVVALIGVVVALLGSLAGTRSLMESVVDDFPGGALLADGHAWLAPLALLLAVGFGVIAELAVRAATGSAGRVLVVVAGVVAVAIPIALLPTLALAADGKLDDARVPQDWWEARQVLLEREPSATLVLPFQAERQYEWNWNQPETAPAQRRTSGDIARLYFPGDVIVEDQRQVRGPISAGASQDPVPGTDPRTAAIREALQGNAEDFVDTLAEYGIDTIVIERGQAGLAAPGRLEAERLYRGPQITIFGLEDSSTATADRDLPPAWLIIAVDVLAALVVLGALVLWIARGRRREEAAV